MRPTLTLTTAAAVLALAACSSSGTKTTASGDQASTNPSVGTSTVKVITASPTPVGPTDANAVMALLTKAIPTAKITGVVTEANDKNALLGRPHEYTSKVTFKDTRISASDTQYLPDGDVGFGGSIEVFATATDAAARAKYIETVTAGLGGMFSEYDYQHGTVLVRVSHYLTPSKAKAYQAFSKTVG